MNPFINIKLFGEDNDVLCTPTEDNIVIKTDYVFKKPTDGLWDNHEFAIVFPDEEKRDYFLTHQRDIINDYREGMLKDDYIFHIVRFKYPKVTELYADQMYMRKDYESF